MPLVAPSFNGVVDVTVFIPTFNGEKYLQLLLEALYTQEFSGSFEILIIDSGSTDSTLSIIRKFSEINLVEIPQIEFGHGRTRNLAANLARGAYIAYLSHDSIPASSTWLKSIISPLQEGGVSVGGVFGKHRPRKNCDPLTKYGIETVFLLCGADNTLTVVGPVDDVGKLQPHEMFYSDVNSATRTQLLRDVIPYQDISYSEDLAFAEDILSAGLIKVYSPFASVIHSNDVTFTEFGKRVFDEHVGMRKAGKVQKKISLLGVFMRAIRDTAKFGLRILTDSDYTLVQKATWLLRLPLYTTRKWINIHRAQNVDLADSDQLSKYSLESSRKPLVK